MIDPIAAFALVILIIMPFVWEEDPAQKAKRIRAYERIDRLKRKEMERRNRRRVRWNKQRVR